MDVDMFENIAGHLFDVFKICLPVFIAFPAIRILFRFLSDSYYYLGDSSIVPNTPEDKEPEKPAGSVTKIYVNSSPVKMEPTSKSRDIPKRCPNCWGIPDNSECCQYCGSKF